MSNEVFDDLDKKIDASLFNMKKQAYNIAQELKNILNEYNKETTISLEETSVEKFAYCTYCEENLLETFDHEQISEMEYCPFCGAKIKKGWVTKENKNEME